MMARRRDDYKKPVPMRVCKARCPKCKRPFIVRRREAPGNKELALYCRSCKAKMRNMH